MECYRDRKGHRDIICADQEYGPWTATIEGYYPSIYLDHRDTGQLVAFALTRDGLEAASVSHPATGEHHEAECSCAADVLAEARPVAEKFFAVLDAKQRPEWVARRYVALLAPRTFRERAARYWQLLIHRDWRYCWVWATDREYRRSCDRIAALYRAWEWNSWAIEAHVEDPAERAELRRSLRHLSGLLDRASSAGAPMRRQACGCWRYPLA